MNRNLPAHCWKKGESGNRNGRPRNQFSRTDLKKAISKCLNLTALEVAQLLQNPDGEIVEVMIAGIMAKITSTGDERKLRALFEIYQGRPLVEAQTAAPEDEGKAKTGYQLIMEDLKKFQNES